MFWSILLILIFVLIFYKYLTWYSNYWIERGVPGPKPKVFFGNFKNSTLQNENLIYEIDRIYKEYRHSSPYAGVFSGRDPHLLILDSAYVKDVLIREFKSFHDNKFANMFDSKKDAIFAQNPFILTGEEWKDKRSEITPAFTTKRLKAMYPIIEDVCSRLTKYIKSELDKNSFEPMEGKELSSKFTCEVVSNCIYGIDSKSFSSEKSILREMGSSFFATSPKILIYFVLIELFPFITKFFRMAVVPKKLEKFFTQLLVDAIKMRKEQNIERDDFVNFLLEMRKKKDVSDMDMACNTVTFFIDGFETSSNVIGTTLYLLAKNRNAQEVLRDEIKRTINNDGKISFEQLTEMEYLDQVLNESLRLVPPGGALHKLCTEEVTFTDYKDKKLIVEKGLTAIIPVYSIHHDTDIYGEDADDFKPERFSEANGGTKKYKEKGVFLPFGDGPRVCLGMKFGLTQSKAAIVEIVRNFDLKVNNKTTEPLVMDPKQIIVAPLGGVWLDFQSINE